MNEAERISPPSLALGPSAAEMAMVMWWMLSGVSFSLIRASPSWDSTRLLIQFSFTKTCQLLWGVSPPPLLLPLFPPSSLPSLLTFPCSGTGNFCNFPSCFSRGVQREDPKEMSKSDVAAILSPWDLTGIWTAVCCLRPSTFKVCSVARWLIEAMTAVSVPLWMFPFWLLQLIE